MSPSAINDQPQSRLLSNFQLFSFNFRTCLTGKLEILIISAEILINFKIVSLLLSANIRFRENQILIILRLSKRHKNFSRAISFHAIRLIFVRFREEAQLVLTRVLNYFSNHKCDSKCIRLLPLIRQQTANWSEHLFLDYFRRSYL